MRYLVGVVKRHPASRRVIQRMPAAARVPVLLVGLVLWAGLLLSTAAHVTPVAYADTSKPSVTIVFPAPASNGVATGPVGTNVTIQAAGLTATDKYVLGYATQNPGCAGGFQGITDTPFGINTDGTYSTTFSWPATAKDIGASYVVCMQDSSQATNPPPPVQSGQTFIVAGASAPAVTLKHVPQPTPGPGTPTPAPQPNTRFYSDEQIVVSGTSFYTSGANVAVYLTIQPIKVKTDLVNALQATAGSFSPDANGAFTATVQLPGATDPGTYYVYAVSADGSDSAPPSLAAFKKISIVERPTPVPTATAKAHSTATARTGNNTTGGDGIQNPMAALGLGALSIVLFVVGVILLASAAGTPRANR